MTAMDLRRILKVYNYVNDERRPKVNVKFLGLMAAFLGIGALLVVFALSNPMGSGGPDQMAAAEKSDYVGLTDVEGTLYATDLERTESIIEARMDSWLARHPEADIVSFEKHYNDAGVWTGYDLTYRE